MMRPGKHFQVFGVGDGRKQAGLVGIYTVSISTVFCATPAPPQPPEMELSFSCVYLWVLVLLEAGTASELGESPNPAEFLGNGLV